MDDIGLRIKKRRESLGMSMDTLSQLSGVNKSTISRYEAGLVDKIPIKSVKPIAGALKMTPAHLLGWEDSVQDSIPQTEYPGEEIKNADMILKKIMDLDLPVQNLTALYNIAKKMKRKNIEMTIEALEKERKKLEE